jgi:adenylate cyclase
MAEERVQRRLAAILAADVVGYSRLMGEDEVGTRQRFNAHLHELIEPAITNRQGRIVKTTGDALLVEFASVVDAVQCAVKIQNGMVERNTEEPDDQRIEFRIGVNVGDVIIEGADIHGDGVNIAARLEGLADPGGICISGTVFDQIGKRLELPCDDLGEQSVKNISEPLRTYRVRVDGVVSTTPSAKPDEDIPLPMPDKPSIAVLPFANMSGDTAFREHVWRSRTRVFC